MQLFIHFFCHCKNSGRFTASINQTGRYLDDIQQGMPQGLQGFLGSVDGNTEVLNQTSSALVTQDFSNIVIQQGKLFFAMQHDAEKVFNAQAVA